MKTKEIATVVIAGILSLGALVLLETREAAPLSSPDPDESPSFAFEDNSSLFEPSLPAPTAEPPAAPSEENANEEPAPNPSERSGMNDALVDDRELVGPPTSLAGLGPEVEETDPRDVPAEEPIEESADFSRPEQSETFDKTFADAVAEATGSTESGATESSSTDPGADEPASIIEETPTGFWLREAKLNDVFQHLAQLADHQYFHNAELEGPEFVVTGQLMDDDPVKQMEELALMYGITIHKKGNTVYALNNAQLTRLPTEPFRYQLKYLRPSDIEQIKLILQPFLTPGSGIIEYETKTNTLIVMDNERKLDALAMFLQQIDQPKQQIAIETRILRVTSNSANRIGVDWSSVLGESGTTLSSTSSLNALFNLPSLDQVQNVITATGAGLQTVPAGTFGDLNSTRTREFDQADLVLSPLQLNAVIRALNEGGLAQQESSPTLIAEDNEEGLISIIDRIPIITTTISETQSGQNVTEEVRYTIDESDPVGDPATTREIGVSVAVTPTILPDNTIRMALRPRSAQVVEFIAGANGNRYPRVNESTVTTTARVPNGYSLLIGGFYEESNSESKNKVPILGDIPAVNLLFKSAEKVKEHTSLVFIVTPRLYRPQITSENERMMHEIHDSHVLPTNHDYPDPDHPGHNYESDLRNTTNNIFNKYEPDAPTNILDPAHPYNLPQSRPVHGKTRSGSEEPRFRENPSVSVRPVGERRKGGLLGKMFGGNKESSR